MRRRTFALVATLMVGIPVTASAATGWVLPQAVGIHGDRVNTSYGCAKSQFGVYTLVGTITTNGVQGKWTVKLDITSDQRLHAVKDVSFASYTPASVRRQVRSIYAQTRYHYVVIGGVSYLQGIWHGGKQQDLQAFNPHRGRCGS
jgi:hypothetical protein